MKTKWITKCLIVMLSAILFSSITYGDFVTINGRDWRQLTDTALGGSIQYNELAAKYDTSTGLLLSTNTDNIIRGVDFTGWTWASKEDVLEMYETFVGVAINGPGGNYMYDEADSAWAPAYFSVFGSTITAEWQSQDRYAEGITRSSGLGPGIWDDEIKDRPYISYIFDQRDPLLDDGVIIHHHERNPPPGYLSGVHLYKMSAVPEPTTIALLGIGLVGLAGAEAIRRRKKKAVGNS